MFDQLRLAHACAQRSAAWPDLVHAWSCATSFCMCQTGHSQHSMSGVTRLALVNVHAQQLLVLTRADPGRLQSLAELCRRRSRTARSWRGGWAMAGRRRGSLSSSCSSTSWAFVLGATTRASRADIATRWTIGAELVEAALTKARRENADVCLSARARLVAQADRAVAGVDWSQFRNVAEPGVRGRTGRTGRGGEHAAWVRGFAEWDVTARHGDHRLN